MGSKLPNILLLILLSILIPGQFEKSPFNYEAEINEATVSSVYYVLDTDASHLTAHSHLTFKKQGQDDTILPPVLKLVRIVSYSKYQPNAFSHKTKMTGFFSARKYQSNYLS